MTYFWKTFTLAITFKPEVIGLLYRTCVFLVTRPFTWYHIFFTLWPWPWSFIYFSKKFNLGNNIQTISDRAFILHVCIPCDNTFYHNLTLTLKFDLLMKNFNLGCYLVMVAARRASLSSDNSYFENGWSYRHAMQKIKPNGIFQQCFHSTSNTDNFMSKSCVFNTSDSIHVFLISPYWYSYIAILYVFCLYVISHLSSIHLV